MPCCFIVVSEMIEMEMLKCSGVWGNMDCGVNMVCRIFGELMFVPLA